MHLTINMGVLGQNPSPFAGTSAGLGGNAAMAHETSPTFIGRSDLCSTNQMQ
jgi:hypothetical protein